MKNQEQIKKQIDLDKEIIFAVPRKSKKNKEEYLEKSKELYLKYEKLLTTITNVLKKRHAYYLSFQSNEEIEILSSQLKKLETKLLLFNLKNSPYEKTVLDKLVYDIGKYYKSNFCKLTNDIARAIEIFDEVGIKLSPQSFEYSEYAKQYMEVFFEKKGDGSSAVLKRSFEEIYWKKPDIVKYIQHNFRFLYYQNEEKFANYIEKLKHEHIEEIGDEKTTLQLYGAIKKKLNKAIDNDKSLYLQKFSNEELKITDYKPIKLKELYKQITNYAGDVNNLDNAIKNLCGTLVEYQRHLKFKFLVDNVIEVYQKDKKELGSSKNKLIEIKKAEQILMGMKQKGLLGFSKKIKMEVTIEEIEKMYNELDELIFIEKVVEFINNNSKIKDALDLIASYYVYVARMIKTNLSDEPEKINENYDELRKFLLEQSNTIINNLTLFDEHNIPMIVSDKYVLDNLSITEEMIEEEKIADLLKIVEKIIVGINVRELPDLSVNAIEEFLIIDKKLKEDA